MSHILNEKVVNIEKLSHSIYKMTVSSKTISSKALPGQFVSIKCCEGLNALLRRPISICGVNKIDGTFDIAFQTKGTGTGYLSQKTIGSTIDIIGPLGTPFDLSPEYKKIAVVGGGIGIFPLLFILQEKKCDYKAAFLGFRDKEHSFFVDEFRTLSDSLYLATEDGSMGFKGYVTQLFDETLAKDKYDIIYSCGPQPVLQKVSDISRNNSILCQVSLEQRMGCGIGACLVCACKTKGEDGWKYSHVCKDGPVFWSDDVIFD